MIGRTVMPWAMITAEQHTWPAVLVPGNAFTTKQGTSEPFPCREVLQRRGLVAAVGTAGEIRRAPGVPGPPEPRVHHRGIEGGIARRVGLVRNAEFPCGALGTGSRAVAAATHMTLHPRHVVAGADATRLRGRELLPRRGSCEGSRAGGERRSPQGIPRACRRVPSILRLWSETGARGRPGGSCGRVGGRTRSTRYDSAERGCCGD